MGLPVTFIELLKENLGVDQINALTNSILTPKIESIRYNRNKSTNNKNELPIPWCQDGVYLKERPSYTLDPNFHAGKYYVQEASSMFLSHVLKNLDGISSVNYALDLCAAPGGKSTLVLDNIPSSACLVANEVIQQRAKILKENIIKWGRNNAIVTNNDPKDFNSFDSFFDLVVVDAPCSGEGMFRKDPNAINEWSKDNVLLCHRRQQRILSNAVKLVASQGYLIYSTCTYNHFENVDNVKWILDTYPSFECIDIPIDAAWGISTIEQEEALGYQFYPHKTKGEGFFISVLRNKATGEANDIRVKKTILDQLSKKEENILLRWLKHKDDVNLKINKHGDVYLYNTATSKLIDHAIRNLKVVYSGVKCGNLQRDIFKPDHALAVSDYVNVKINTAELSRQEALSFLNKTLSKVEDAPKGWNLITYEGAGLGWIKNIGNRINNYLPNSIRIKMKID